MCLFISAQESLEHSPSDQGSPDISFSSQEDSGTSVDIVSLGHSSSDPRVLGLSDSDDRTLEVPPFPESILEIQSYNNGITETSTTYQDSLEYLPPSVQNLQPSPITRDLRTFAKSQRALYDFRICIRFSGNFTIFLRVSETLEI